MHAARQEFKSEQEPRQELNHVEEPVHITSLSPDHAIEMHVEMVEPLWSVDVLVRQVGQEPAVNLVRHQMYHDIYNSCNVTDYLAYNLNKACRYFLKSERFN